MLYLCLTMMFNGLMCGDSDTSDFTMESVPSWSACSDVGYYQNKLLATTQILQNKEETVSVQARSLAVAEERIAGLAARCKMLRNELDQKNKELQKLNSLKTQKNDVCPSTHTQEVDNQHILSALQNNLSVIEELYRECFYEAAKQESLIEMLRQCCAEVRERDRDKTERINSLHQVIDTQRCSLEKCQDISLEVDNLKTEISNFLNGSNNDSGMWEENSVLGTGVSDGTGVSVGEGNDVGQNPSMGMGELQDIQHQLLRLRELLTTECPCEMEEENKKLRQTNQDMETQIGDLQNNIHGLETALREKNSLEQENKEKMEALEKEAKCACELVDENKKLKQINRNMETQIDDLQEKICTLVMTLRSKSSLEQKNQEKIEALEKEAKCARDLIDENKNLKQTNQNMESKMTNQESKIIDLKSFVCKKTCLLQKFKEEIEAKKKELQTLRESLKTQKINDCVSSHSNVSQPDCTCQLEKECVQLKKSSQNMETQPSDLTKKIHDLEIMLCNKSSLNQKYKEDIESKEKELQILRMALNNQTIDACPSRCSNGSQTVCPCEIDEEIKKLMQRNEKLKTQISDQQKKISDLEMMLHKKSILIKDYEEEISAKDKQLVNIDKKLSALEEENRSRACDHCSSLTLQLQQTQEKLNMSELATVQLECEARRQDSRALHTAQEHAALVEQGEVTADIRDRLAESERRAAALQLDLCHERTRVHQLEARYRSQVSSAAVLSRSLRVAQARGGALCVEASGALEGVRRWADTLHKRHWEQEQKLKEKDIQIEALQRRLEARQHDIDHTDTSERDDDPKCSKCVANRSAHTSLSAFPSCTRQRDQTGTSTSEIASCSSAPPVPPKRTIKKYYRDRCSCRERDSGRVGGSVCVGGSARVAGSSRAASMHTNDTYHCHCHQHHRQKEPASSHHIVIPSHERELSPSEMLYRRVEHLGAALADSYRRWTTHNNNNDR